MADGVDIDLYNDDIDPNFSQMKVRTVKFSDNFNRNVIIILTRS